MITPDLSVLAKLEATAAAAWHEVHHPAIGQGQSINPVTNKEHAFIKAIRADQAVAGWYLNHATQIKQSFASCEYWKDQWNKQSEQRDHLYDAILDIIARAPRHSPVWVIANNAFSALYNHEPKP